MLNGYNNHYEIYVSNIIHSIYRKLHLLIDFLPELIRCLGVVDVNIIEQNKEKINGVLSTFDRMIINGYILPFHNPRLFLFYLIQNNIKLVDFDKFAEEQTSSLCSHIDNYIKENNTDLQYLKSGKDDKQAMSKEALKQSNGKIGLIAAYSAVELCKTMTVKGNHKTKKLETVSRNTKCKHYYLYYNDEEFGFMFVKIQTWFPYNVQIYINGREYLSKIFDKNNVKYEMFNNSFSYIDNFDKAQKLADNILNQKLSDSFDGMIEKINNLLPNIKEKMNHSYYWCIDQCEFATDINFKSRDDLSVFYKKLIETSFFTFSSTDIYSFFGRNISRIHNFTNGEITSDLRNRYQGYRIKFKINNNQIKMYDKRNNLRIEVTINNPKDFKVMKEREIVVEHEKIEKKRVWLPMGKSVSNLYRYVEISKSIIKRYIEALPEIDTDTVPLKEIENISERKEIDGKVFTGFNVLNKDTLNAFQVISNAKYLINGFTNKSIRNEIFGDESKKNICKTTRLLSKLRAHGIIKKVAKKNKYYLTTDGRKILNSILIYTRKQLL